MKRTRRFIFFVLKFYLSLHAIPVQNLCSKAAPGAVVSTDSALFFIAAGLGRQWVDGREVYFLSPKAPMALLLLQKAAGQPFAFNGRSFRIKELY